MTLAGYQPATSASFTVAANANTAVPTIQLTAQQVGTVSGKVVDGGGHPLTGATVRIDGLLPPVPLASNPKPTATTGDPAEPVELTATTGSDGTYTIANVPVGSHTVTASKTGYSDAQSGSFTVAANTTTNAPDVTLNAIAAGSVSGQVTDASGTPLANVQISIAPATILEQTPPMASGGGSASSSASSTDIPVRFPGFYTATTDASGNYSVPSVVTGAYIVTASLSGYNTARSSSFTVTANTNSAVPTLALAKTVYGTVSGVIDDATGKPISGATVNLWPQGFGIFAPESSSNSVSKSDAIFFPFPGGNLTATTASDGTYTISNVPLGTYTATASAQGFTSASSASFKVADTNPVTIPTIQLTALVTGTVSGSVLDSSGAAAANVTVVLEPFDGEGDAAFYPTSQPLTATTDANGKYTIASVPVGTYVATAFASDFSSSGSSASFAVTANATTTVPAITLQAAPAFGDLNGDVSSDDGSSAGGDFVQITPTNPGGTPTAAAHTTLKRVSSNGKFSIGKLKPGAYTVTVLDKSHHTLATTTANVTSSSTTLAPISVPGKVHKQFEIVGGAVSDASGKPLAHAKVTLSVVTSGSTKPHTITVRTNKLGAFKFSHILAGQSYSVSASLKGYLTNTSAVFLLSNSAYTVPTITLATA